MRPLPWHSMEMRRMNVDNYSVFYVLRGGTVYVTDVLYSASDIEARLKGRFPTRMRICPISWN